MEQGHLLSLGQAGRAGLSRDDLAKRLAEHDRRHDRSDLNTDRILRNDESNAVIRQKGLKPAAVLVPLVIREAGLTVLLTQRTAHLANHAGQISFPGGRMEEADASPEEAALRETEEETGLPRAHVALIGRLDNYVTITGFEVVPCVGLVTPPFPLAPDPFEVAEVFEVPLAHLIDPANHQHHSRLDPNGKQRYYYAIPYGERYIWGATAGMLVNLSEVLR